MGLHLLINGSTSYATEVMHILHFVLQKFQDSRYFAKVFEVFEAEVSAVGEIRIMSHYSKENMLFFQHILLTVLNILTEVRIFHIFIKWSMVVDTWCDIWNPDSIPQNQYVYSYTMAQYYNLKSQMGIHQAEILLYRIVLTVYIFCASI